jgi:hypothetical protein
MKNLFLTLLLASINITVASAQGSTGELKGTIIDQYTGNPIEMAVIKLQSGTNTLGDFTDIKGAFSISGIPVGKYEVEISALGYQSRKINDVTISNGSITFIDRGLNVKEGKVVEIIFEQWKEDLLGKGTPGTMFRLDAEQITQTASLRDVGTLIGSSVPKVYMRDDGGDLNFSGSRTGATLYMIDGVKVIGDPQIPNRGIGEIVVITGGIPAQYGDTTSGVVLISTKSF